jgi:CheY-like chemotaxis protein
MRPRAKFLIVEDNPADIVSCRSLLQKADPNGEVEILSTIPRALSFLEEVKAGSAQAPRLVILDLDFGGDSGFEFLRAWRSHNLKQIPVIVWTALEETMLKVSGMFGVNDVVAKRDGADALDQAIARVLSPSAESATGETGR